MNRFIVTAVFALVFINGCAFTDQKAVLNPTLEFSSQNFGNGQQVGIKVLDERPDKTLGYRGAQGGNIGGKITTDQDVAKVLEDKIKEGLKMQGFEPTSYSDGVSRTMKVELRSLKYFISTGFWSGGAHTKSALKVIARNSGKEFEEFYRVEKEETIIFIPGAEGNEQLINSALSEILQKLFTDQKLFEFLGN